MAAGFILNGFAHGLVPVEICSPIRVQSYSIDNVMFGLK